MELWVDQNEDFLALNCIKTFSRICWLKASPSFCDLLRTTLIFRMTLSLRQYYYAMAWQLLSEMVVTYWPWLLNQRLENMHKLEKKCPSLVPI